MQMDRRSDYRAYALIGLGLLLSATGCKNKPAQSPQQPPPTQPPPSLTLTCGTIGDIVTVEVNVIRILHDGSHAIAADAVGERTNRGCRLSDAEISEYVTHAAAFYEKGAHVRLHWQGPIQDYRCDLKMGLDQNAGADLRGRRTLSHFLMNEVLDSEHNHFDSGKLNIFFGGNYRVDGDGDFQPDIPPPGYEPEKLLGNTNDPFDQTVIVIQIGTNEIHIPPYILMCDGAFWGEYEQVPVYQAEWRILEHELGHFFLRRRGEGWAGQYNPTPYDGSEHSTDLNYPGLMRARPPHGAGMVLITDPNNPYYPMCEKYEVWHQAHYPLCPAPSQCQQ